MKIRLKVKSKYIDGKCYFLFVQIKDIAINMDSHRLCINSLGNEGYDHSIEFQQIQEYEFYVDSEMEEDYQNELETCLEEAMHEGK